MDSPSPSRTDSDPVAAAGSNSTGHAPPDCGAPDPQQVKQAETAQEFSTLSPSQSAAAGDSRAPGALATSQFGFTSHLSPLTSPPPHVPDYELLRRIGSGSYGDVWLARNVLGQCRAVKIIYRSRFVDPRPFEREFEGIQRFEPISRSHPSQLAILHVGKNDAAGCFYYVMELADCAEGEKEKRGRGAEENNPSAPAPAPLFPFSPLPLFSPASYTPHTLRHDLERHSRLPIPDCVQIGLSLATALAHLHEQGLVHRDIKPSNIIFVNGVAKLGDIGLVTEAGDTQSIVGTEGYLPPEGPGTPQADLFSLGKVLYEMSTGMDRRRFAELPDDLREWPDRNAVFEFNPIVLHACAKDPEQRYQTTEQLRADLALLQEGKSVQRTRRNRRLWARVKKTALGLILLALVVAGFAHVTRQTQRNEASGDGPPSTNELANALCAKGLLILRGDNYAAYAETYTNLHRAIELDPNFAKPYVGLLELLVREHVPGLNSGRTNELRTVAQRLKELAPDLAATRCSQSIVSFYGWDYPKAKEYARQAILADPSYELGHTWYGFMLTRWGSSIESRRELEISRRLLPSKVTIYRCLAHTYYVQRDYSKAIAMYREAIGWEPHHVPAYKFAARACQALGDYSNAISYFERQDNLSGNDGSETQAYYSALRQALATGGAHGYWQEQWKHAETNPVEDLYEKAAIQICLGNTNSAVSLLKRSYELQARNDWNWDSNLNNLLFDEYWDPLHDDPRFRDLLEKLGFTKVMQKRP